MVWSLPLKVAGYFVEKVSIYDVRRFQIKTTKMA